MTKSLLPRKIFHRLETNWEMLKTAISCKRTVRVNGTDIAYKIPKDLSLSQMVYARYLRTKYKEEDTFFWLTSHKKNTDRWQVFIDIGCNIGVFSLLARNLYDTINIFSFDPILSNCLITYQMLKENTPAGSLSVVQQAFLADAVKIQTSINLLASHGSTIGNTKERKVNHNFQQESCLSIPLSSFGLMGKQEVGLKNTICKIDVDGNELEIIKGFSNEQLAATGSLCVEIDMLEPDTTIEIDNILTSHGFIRSQNNQYSMDPYIKLAQPEEKKRLMALKNGLFNETKTEIDDGLNSYLDKLNYHASRAERVFSNYYSLQENKRQSHRLALNWFYYRTK